MCSSSNPPTTLNFRKLHTCVFSYLPNFIFFTIAGRCNFSVRNCGGVFEYDDHRDTWLFGQSSRIFLANDEKWKRKEKIVSHLYIYIRRLEKTISKSNGNRIWQNADSRAFSSLCELQMIIATILYFFIQILDAAQMKFTVSALLLRSKPIIERWQNNNKTICVSKKIMP